VKVEYLGGGFKPGEFLEQPLPEIAFIGRSNVGKSSLINMLVNQRQMARVSSTPGRTQAIHFFAVANRFCLVDLPGYGYAKAPKKIRNAWRPLVQSYLSNREKLRLAILLLDVRRDPREDESRMVSWLQECNIPLLLVATKIDKVPRTRRGGRLQQLAAQLGVAASDILGVSALKREGRDTLWSRIEQLIDSGD
jgi:GTP-binding protein